MFRMSSVSKLLVAEHLEKLHFSRAPLKTALASWVPSLNTIFYYDYCILTKFPEKASFSMSFRETR